MGDVWEVKEHSPSLPMQALMRLEEVASTLVDVHCASAPAPYPAKAENASPAELLPQVTVSNTLFEMHS